MLKISSSQAIPVSLIANEVISNSMKHGIKNDVSGEIRINISDNSGIICMEFYDSGKNELRCDMNSENKLGLQIVKALAQEQLGGSFTINKENGETKVEIIFGK